MNGNNSGGGLLVYIQNSSILLFPKYFQFCMPKGEHMDKECKLGKLKKKKVLGFKMFGDYANVRPCLWFGLGWWAREFALCLGSASAFLRACLGREDCFFVWGDTLYVAPQKA